MTNHARVPAGAILCGTDSSEGATSQTRATILELAFDARRRFPRPTGLLLLWREARIALTSDA